MLKKPVVTEVRTPTNTWSGLGFSKSMPAETIKELRRANHVPYKPSMSTTFEVRLSAPSVFVNPEFIYCHCVYVCKRLHRCNGLIDVCDALLRGPRCPCRDPAAGRSWGTAATRRTGETETGTGCRVTQSSPLLSAAPRGSRTSLVSGANVFTASFVTRTKKALVISQQCSFSRV